MLTKIGTKNIGGVECDVNKESKYEVGDIVKFSTGQPLMAGEGKISRIYFEEPFGICYEINIIKPCKTRHKEADLSLLSSPR